jgi:hypothetical protein
VSGIKSEQCPASIRNAVRLQFGMASGFKSESASGFIGIPIRSASDPQQWEKAIEVRDKPVSFTDVEIFGKKCVDMAVREAAVVMASEQQEALDEAALMRWANGFGIGLTLFYGWHDFVDQVLFWSGEPKPIAASRAIGFIRDRLIGVEASPTAVSLWQSLLRPND